MIKKYYKNVLTIFILLLLMFCALPTSVLAKETAKTTTTSSSSGGVTDINEIADMFKYSSSGGNLDFQVSEKQGTDDETFWNKIFSEYKGLIVGATGLATLTFMMLFVVNFMKLAATAGNPTERQKILKGMLWTGLASAGAGSLSIFLSFSMNLFS